MTDNARYYDRPLKYTEEEWQARIQLAACYRIFDHLGWSESIYNHISLRVPGPDAHFLIDPFGLHYSEVRASNLVKVDIEGGLLVSLIGQSIRPVSPFMALSISRFPTAIV